MTFISFKLQASSYKLLTCGLIQQLINKSYHQHLFFSHLSNKVFQKIIITNANILCN